MRFPALALGMILSGANCFAPCLSVEQVAAAQMVGGAPVEEDAQKPSLEADGVSSKPELSLAKLVGSWDVRVDAGGEIYFSRLELELVDGELVGRLDSQGRKSRISNVRLQRNVVFLETSMRRFSTPVIATFAAELVDDRLVGDVDFDSGTGVRSYEFEARRVGGEPSPAAAIAPNESTAPAQGSAGEKPAAAESASEGGAGVSGERPDRSRRRRQVVTFKQGIDGYEQAVDVEIWAIAPSKPLLRQGTMTTDGNNGGGESQVLMRFGEVFGVDERQVPHHARIVGATLTIVAFDPGTTVYLHRLLAPWDGAATWDSMAGGISIDNVEACTVRDGFSFGQINMDKQSVTFDVTATVQKWSDGEPNRGWVFVNTGDNGWDFYSSDWLEPEIRPLLSIEYETR